MREFSDLTQDPGLRKFLDSPLGTLHMVLDDRSVPVRLVRRFDAELSPSLVTPFVELVAATKQWVESHPDIASLVEVEKPNEVGRDFVSRPFHIYSESLMAYEEQDNALEPPQELALMRSRVRAAIRDSSDPETSAIEVVLARSLLQPTFKTYYVEAGSRFVVVEPKLTTDDVYRWGGVLRDREAND